MAFERKSPLLVIVCLVSGSSVYNKMNFDTHQSFLQHVNAPLTRFAPFLSSSLIKFFYFSFHNNFKFYFAIFKKLIKRLGVYFI